MRAVLDVNVLISALLSREGAPARALRAWIEGQFDLVVSPALLAELERALAYPKLQRHIGAVAGRDFHTWLAQAAVLVPDPTTAPPARSSDADDDYLIALAAEQRAFLVSGDRHVLALSGSDFPIVTVGEFLERLAATG